jgi:TolB protein
MKKTLLAVIVSFPLASALVGAAALGAFDNHADIGITPKPGSAQFDSASGEYRVTGGGANIWAKTDAFQFVYSKISGDVTLTADVRFLGQGVEAHRKAGLMIRQSLDPDSVYADVALHGDGLTSLQYRPATGADTQETRSDVKAPTRIRIERHGNQFTIAAGNDNDLKTSGPVTVAMQDPVYIGLAVCSHNANVLETAVFSNLTVQRTITTQQEPPIKRSYISVYDLASKSVKAIYTADKLIEAPNWSPDGKYMLVNTGGDLWRLPDGGGDSVQLEKIDLASITKCNNDKGYSPDGKLIAFSSSANASGSQVYTVASTGGAPKLIVPETPSYFHGFSPDGHWMAIVAQRNHNFDLFRVPTEGGDQQRLTTNPGYDDGPDYSPDGKWIYFNSDRSGSWDIWRMPADGAGPNDEKAQQVTSDELEDWFPHCSPDGKWLVFLAFPKGTAGHNGHTQVQLRMIPLPGDRIEHSTPQVLTAFLGGQGTINVNSWAPDSSKFAFVRYEQ